MKVFARVSGRGGVLAVLLFFLFVSQSATAAGAPESPDAGLRADAGQSPDAAASLSAADAGTSPVLGPDGAAAEAGPAAPAVAPPVAPHARLSGQVFTRGSRRGVSGANVTVDVTVEAETDAKGRFEVELGCGAHHISFQDPAHESFTVVRDPCVDGSALVVRLVPRVGPAEYESVVRAATGHQEMRLQGGELLRTPGTLGDPFRAVESLPGVTSVAWPAPIYAVRGSNPGNTGFFLDDLRVPALFHFAIGPSVIHPYFFQDLDFFAGGYPARYGRYVAGIVAARTKAAPTDDLHASVDVRLFDAGAMVTAPLPGQGSVAVAARYSYTSTVIGLLSDAGVSLGYWDYQLRADRAVGPVRLTLLAFGSDDRLVTASKIIAQRFHRLKLRGETPLAGGLVSASLAVGLDRTQAPIADLIPISISAKSLIPRLGWVRHTTPVDIEVGVDGEIERIEPVTMLERIGELDLGKRRTARLFAAFLSAKVRAGSRLIVTPELRVDSFAVSGAARADVGPRLAARLALDAESWLKLSGGRFSQLPSLPLQVPGAENFGLALYGLQTSWQGALGAGTTRLPGLETTVTGYVQRYRLTDLRDPAITRHVDPFADDFLVMRDALSYGVELLVRRATTERLHGWLSYTLSTSQRALGGGVIGLVSEAVGDSFVRLPSFFQLDLRVDRRFLFDKFSLDAYLELVNATLSRQVTGLTQMGLERPSQDSFRIVLPTIGLHGEF
jgi:hypothetical protein